MKMVSFVFLVFYLRQATALVWNRMKKMEIP